MAKVLTRVVVLALIMVPIIILFALALVPLRMFVAAFTFAELTKHGSWDPYKVFNSKQFQDWDDPNYWLVALGLDFVWLGALVLFLVAICCLCTSLRMACMECCYKIPNDITFWFYDRQGEVTGYNPRYAELGSMYNSKSENLNAITEMDAY